MTNLDLNSVSNPEFYKSFSAAMNLGCPQSYQEAVKGPEAVEKKQGYKLLREDNLAVIYSVDVVFKPEIPMQHLINIQVEKDDEWQDFWEKEDVQETNIIADELDEAIEHGRIVTRSSQRSGIQNYRESLESENLNDEERISEYIPEDTTESQSTGTQDPIDPLVLLCRMTNLDLNSVSNPEFYKSFSAAMNLGCPQSYQEAVKGPEADEWKRAMEKEMASIQEAGTWILKRPKEKLKKPPVKNRWVFTKKFDKNGKIKRYKARLVAKGYSQRFGIDYNETFSPVAKLKSIRILAALCVMLVLEAYQDDVPTAFLKGDLEETVWMEQVEGYESGDLEELCYLLKTLYGLKQSPREWNLVLHKYLISQGFTQSKLDTCIYVNQDGGKPLFVGIYVDDIITVGEEKQANSFREKLRSHFGIQEGGPLEWYLGIAFHRTENGSFILNQKVYLEQKLEEFKEYVGQSKYSSPLPQNYQKLLQNENCDIVIPSNFPYRKIVGSLMYCMLCTRPDIAAAVSVVSRFLEKPKPIHVQLVLRILQYLSNTLDYALIYKPSKKIELTGYVDASYANEIGYKSRSGYAFILGNSLVSWYSGTQSVIAQSAAEAEYYAACSAANEALWLKQLLEDLSYPTKTVVLHEDNQACIALTKNPEDHKRTKHIQVKYHVVRDYVAKKFVSFVYCPTVSQLADLFTKGVPGHLLRSHLKLLGLQSPGES
jgi:hypothetical protein